MPAAIAATTEETRPAKQPWSGGVLRVQGFRVQGLGFLQDFWSELTESTVETMGPEYGPIMCACQSSPTP